MATLTYDPTPADQPEFNEEEQESLKVGEQLAEQQENLLAGKFKDAEELERAYVELQKKLGSRDEETAEDEAEVSTEDTSDEVSPVQTLIANASESWAKDQKLSPEMMEELQSMSSKDLVDAYIAMYGDQSAQSAPEVVDLTDTVSYTHLTLPTILRV